MHAGSIYTRWRPIDLTCALLRRHYCNENAVTPHQLSQYYVGKKIQYKTYIAQLVFASITAENKYTFDAIQLAPPPPFFFPPRSPTPSPPQGRIIGLTDQR